MNCIPIKRALLSVSNKKGLVEFAQGLVDAGIEIISTGGTSQMLSVAAVPFSPIEEVTGLPEMLDGRVKTLHPSIHGGILGRRDEHEREAIKHHIRWIDLVVVNFYPFSDAINEKGDMNWDELVDYIDIGGPTMVRAAAKNFAWVAVVTDPEDYQEVIFNIQKQGGLDFNFRLKLAEKAFALTTRYDAVIHDYFLKKNQPMSLQPQHLELSLEKLAELRYGENPHQRAFAYEFKNGVKGVLAAYPHQGKPLSYNNILDSEAAINCVSEFNMPACAIVKHANPCGVASYASIDAAYQHAYQTDPLSAFGGIVALNRPCTKTIAQAVTDIFIEVILAPSFTEEALKILAIKPNLRVLEIPIEKQDPLEMKLIRGGMLLQERDLYIPPLSDLKKVTKRKPDQQALEEMLFAWLVVKQIKSNGIVITKDHMTLGIGAGQVSRVDAVQQAIRKSMVYQTNQQKDNILQGAVLASDAFFPFRDSIDRIAETSVRFIIQPGGSLRDEEVIAACDEHNIAMVFTGKRCFKH